jgi:DNA-binding transcriptional ArsR family regulator
MLDAREKKAFERALGEKRFDRLPIIFNALSDKTRCKVARLLIKKGARELSVNDIRDVIGISQSALSQHLKVLEVTGIAQKRREGRRMFYSLRSDDPIVGALIKAVL